eukprot:TRINITY_DN10124_c0_g1_i1.p1 TRINITY_DN10124_c0_g1~~TRINITY_DN10124_c0_g1_i1.p1  ORF type:complete len:306 (+),score=26.50 TRINITY_DN10124_c0_g1_i1:46-963(+)
MDSPHEATVRKCFETMQRMFCSFQTSVPDSAHHEVNVVGMRECTDGWIVITQWVAENCNKTDILELGTSKKEGLVCWRGLCFVKGERVSIQSISRMTRISPPEECGASHNTILELAYQRAFLSVLHLGDRQATSATLVGLGSGSLSFVISSLLPSLSLTVVEIDPVVVEAAEVFFGYPPSPSVVTLQQDFFSKSCSAGVSDILILDAFTPSGAPYSTPASAVPLLLSHLKPDAVLAINVVSSIHDVSEWAAALSSTPWRHHVVFTTVEGQAVIVAYIRLKSRQQVAHALEQGGRQSLVAGISAVN